MDKSGALRRPRRACCPDKGLLQLEEGRVDAEVGRWITLMGSRDHLVLQVAIPSWLSGLTSWLLLLRSNVAGRRLLSDVGGRLATFSATAFFALAFRTTFSGRLAFTLRSFESLSTCKTRWSLLPMRVIHLPTSASTRPSSS